MHEGIHHERLLPVEERRMLEDERKRLPPGAHVRFDLGRVRLAVDDVRREDAVHSLFEKRENMAVRDLDREARLGDGRLDPLVRDLLVRLRAEHDLEAEGAEIGAPEGMPVVEIHRTRDADARLRGARSARRRGVDRAAELLLHERNVVALEELVVERHEIRNGGLPRHLGALAVAVAALVAPVRLVPLDVELLDVAVVRAARAGELAELVVDGGEVVAAEGRLDPERLHLFAHEERCADRADDAVVGRDDDLLAEHFAERGRDGVVVRRASLEEYDRADLASPNDSIEIVLDDRVREPRDDVVLRGALLQVGRDVLFHIDGAALAEPERALRRKGAFGELVHDLHVELLRLLLEEGARSRRARLVHREVDDDPVGDADELRVLAADLEDRVDLLADHRVSDERGARLVRRDLVDDRVRADELADELAAGARRPDAADTNLVSHLALDLLEPFVHDLDRPRLGAQVDLLDDEPVVVDEREVRAHRADVDAEVGVDGEFPPVEIVFVDAVAEEEHAVAREALQRRKLGSGLGREVSEALLQSGDVEGPLLRHALRYGSAFRAVSTA